MRDLYDELDAAGKRYIDGLRNRASTAAKAVKPKKRGHPERDTQRKVVKWLRDAGCIVQSAGTEQKASGKTDEERMRFGAARKASGATTGFPDLTVVTPNGRVFFIEMKAPKGVLSDAQKMIHADLRSRGNIVIVGRSLEGVQDDLAMHGATLARRMALAVPVQPLAEGV